MRYLKRMPGKARIGAPGALHHIVIRGIEGTAIFKDDQLTNKKSRSLCHC